MAKRAGKPAAVVKLSVSIDREDEAWLRSRARREDRAFSEALGQIVRDARREELRREVRVALLGRELTAEELSSAQRELDALDAAPRKRRTA